MHSLTPYTLTTHFLTRHAHCNALCLQCCTVIGTFLLRLGLGVMIFNATFSNISAILWLSVLLVEETGISGENHRPPANH